MRWRVTFEFDGLCFASGSFFERADAIRFARRLESEGCRMVRVETGDVFSRWTPLNGYNERKRIGAGTGTGSTLASRGALGVPLHRRSRRSLRG